MKRMSGGANHQDNCHHETVRAMNATYYASCAPTSEFIIHKGQGQLDYCFDRREQCKSVKIAPTRWLVWNFEKWYLDLDKDQCEELALHFNLPAFLRVRMLDVSKNVGK